MRKNIIFLLIGTFLLASCGQKIQPTNSPNQTGSIQEATKTEKISDVTFFENPKEIDDL